MKKLFLSATLILLAVLCLKAEKQPNYQTDTISIMYCAKVDALNSPVIVPGPPLDIVSRDETEIEFSIYPNPATNYITVKLNNLTETKSEPVYLYVYDMMGRIVLKYQDFCFAGSIYQKEINVRVLPKGDYTIKLNKGKYAPIKKFRVYY